jgi:hypothetical protein
MMADIRSGIRYHSSFTAKNWWAQQALIIHCQRGWGKMERKKFSFSRPLARLRFMLPITVTPSCGGGGRSPARVSIVVRRGIELKKHAAAFALALPFALLGANAQADGWFCSSRLEPVSNGYSMCAGSEAGTGVIVGDTTATLFQPDAFSDAPVAASRMSVSGGIFAGVANAASSSSLGVLGGSATAESLNAVPPAVGEHATGASAKTDAAFFDSGTLISAAGAPVGAAVSLGAVMLLVTTFRRYPSCLFAIPAPELSHPGMEPSLIDWSVW